MPNASETGQVGLFEDQPGLTGRAAQERALEHGQPLCLKYRGRSVPERRAAAACVLLDDFNELTGQRLPMFRPDGSASESLKRVLGALTAYDHITIDEWGLTMRAVLANPWWGDGPASIGAVFGPRVVEDNLANPGRGRGLTASERAERDKRQRTLERLAVIRGAVA